VNLTNKGKIATHLARHNSRISAEKVWLCGQEVRYNFGTIEVEIFGRFLGVSDTNETIYVKRLPACKAGALVRNEGPEILQERVCRVALKAKPQANLAEHLLNSRFQMR
jgi:hypothetical protein